MSELSTEQFMATYRTNVSAMFWIFKAAVAVMPAGGSIVTTGSIESYQPDPFVLNYASTKAAIVNFTRGLARQVAAKGIRVNSVCSGPVWTPLQPAKLAPAYVYFASGESSYVTGETLGVTGGVHIA